MINLKVAKDQSSLACFKSFRQTLKTQLSQMKITTKHAEMKQEEKKSEINLTQSNSI